jgi:poly-beta-hydroxyalkanoate depolymerase
VFALHHGEEVHVIACSPGCEWLRILSLNEADAQHWIPAVFAVVNGPTDSLPVLTPR